MAAAGEKAFDKERAGSQYRDRQETLVEASGLGWLRIWEHQHRTRQSQ